MTVERRISELPEATAAALGMDIPINDSGVTRRISIGTLLASMEVLGYAVGVGPAGASFRSGSGVPGSGLGANGDTYLNSANGDLYTRASSVWTLSGNLQGGVGVTGDAGANGATIHLVTIAPTSGLGVENDIAIDVSATADSGNVYLKTSGGWELSGNIRGAEGAIGTTIPVASLPAGITPTGVDLVPIHQGSTDVIVTVAQLAAAVGQSAETVDALPVVTAFAGTDEVLTRQSGTNVLRGTVANLLAYFFSQMTTYTAPKLSLGGNTTLSAATHAGRILIVTATATLTFDDALWSDGQRCIITNHATVPITIASTTGTIGVGNATNTLPVGATVEMVRYTYSSEVYYKALGASPAAPIAVSTPANIVTGSPLIVTGSYGQSSTTALEYSLDGRATWHAATGAAFVSGAYSFSVAGVAASGTAYVIYVRDAGNTALEGASGQFTVSAGAVISVTTPTGVNTGQNITIAGTYTGTPTSIQYSFDGTGAWNTLVAAPSGGVYTASVLAPITTGAHTVTVRFSNATGVTALSGSFTMTAVAYVTIATPADQSLGSNVGISGTYGHITPTGFDYKIDAGSWVTSGAVRFGSGIWACPIPSTSFVAGTHTVTVRLKNSTSTTATTAVFSVIDYTTGGGYDPGVGDPSGGDPYVYSGGGGEGL